MRLHDGVEQQNRTVEDHSNAEIGQNRRRGRNTLGAIVARKQTNDWLRQHSQPHRARHGDQAHGTHSGLLRMPRTRNVVFGQCSSHGRDDRDCDGRNE